MNSNNIGTNNYLFEDDVYSGSKEGLTNFDKVMLGRADELMNQEWMDFKQFANYLKVFNVKYPVDLKIKFYFKIFDTDGDGMISRNDLKKYIELCIPTESEEDFDKEDENPENEDDKNNNKNDSGNYVENNDIKDTYKTHDINALARHINDQRNLEVSEKKENDYKFDLDTIIDIIFKEVLGNTSKNSIDYDDFNKIMWITNIDTVCVLDLKV